MNQSPRPLTAKEKSVLEFIEGEILKNGISPSYQEICDHFGFASYNSVQNYLKQLTQKGYVRVLENQKRGIQILHSPNTHQNSVSDVRPTNSGSSRSLLLPPPSEHGEILTLPLLGRVAAGQPLEAFEHNEFVQVPPSLVRNPSRSYALRVVGSSMIEDGIFDGDLLLVQKQSTASNGEIVVASVDNESTVKRFYLQNGTVEKKRKTTLPERSAKGSLSKQVELRPANSTMKSMWYSADQVSIQGIVVGLIRQF
jgi:repressor LexA